MSNAKRRTLAGFGVAVFSVIVLVAVVPQRHIPERLAPVVTAKGRFEGQPLRFPRPKGGGREVPATIRIKMDQGMCRGSLIQGTRVTGLFNVGEGQCLANIPVGGELVLDPQGKTGDYDITIGSEWHPLGPKGRRLVLLPMGLTFIVASILPGKLRSQARRLGGKRFLFVLGIAVISGLVLYPVLHEGGHMICGMLLGAKPDWDGVVWTCLGGQEPHGSFSYLPPGAGPFMSAGGHLVPTVVALLFLLVWRLVCRRASWPVSAALVLLPVLILFSTLGCLFELYQNTHMDALSVHLGLSGPLRVAFSLSPLFVAIAAYLWLGLRCRTYLNGTRNNEAQITPQKV